MKPDKNKQLMLDAGSTTGAYDIEAPDQWNWVMRHATDPLERAMAWVKSNTTAFRHESPFCVNDQKLPLSYRHLAADMEWADQTAKNILGELQKQGRVKLKAKRIWYCANVPRAYEKSAIETEQSEGEEPQKGRTIGERKYRVQSTFGAYVADSIGKLPEEKLLECLDEHEAWLPRKRRFFADLMAAGRIETDRHEDNMLLRWGIPKKRLPKRRPAEIKSVKLQMLLDLSSVQSTESPCTNSPDDFVDARAVVTQQQQQQKSAPRSPSSVHINGKTTAAAALLSAAPPPVSPSPASALIESFVARELNLDDEAAQQLVAGCKDVEPSVTGPEIVELAREKQHTMKEQVRTGKITSPVGLLIKHVPKMCKGGTLQAVRERLEAVARDRATRIGYAREAWPELNAEERAEVLQKYPELAELRQGAGA